MSTRAVYEFVDQHERFAIYIHMDGYPEGALRYIRATLDLNLSWWPRYEASDFSAAFVAANKRPGGGNVYLSKGHEAHGDLSYWYEISKVDKCLHVKAYRGNGETKIFDGSLEEFAAFATSKNAV